MSKAREPQQGWSQAIESGAREKETLTGQDQFLPSIEQMEDLRTEGDMTPSSSPNLHGGRGGFISPGKWQRKVLEGERYFTTGCDSSDGENIYGPL